MGNAVVLLSSLSDGLNGKRTAAAATVRSAGILKDEALPHQRLFIIKSDFVEVRVALGVNKYARAVLIENFVSVASLRFEPHSVGQSGAAAALDSQAQTTLCRYTFFSEQFSDFLGCLFRDVKHFGIEYQYP